jgi:hypothetical protein
MHCFPMRRDPASYSRAVHDVNARLAEWWISRKWTNKLASKKRRSYFAGYSRVWLWRILCALKTLAALVEMGIRSFSANQVANHVTKQTNNILDRQTCSGESNRHSATQTIPRLWIIRRLITVFTRGRLWAVEFTLSKNITKTRWNFLRLCNV